MPEPAKPLHIFLSYAHTDVVAVRKLHRYLCEKGFDVWFDKEKLVPGHDWRLEVEQGLNNADVVMVCLSQTSVSKEGFVQREFKFALDRTLEMPDGRIFLIPVRLDTCEVPIRLARFHWVDLFEREGYQHLMRGLKLRAEQLERARVDEAQQEQAVVEKADVEGQKKKTGNQISINNSTIYGNVIAAENIQDSFNVIEKAHIQTDLKEHLKQLAESVDVMVRTLPKDETAEVVDNMKRLIEEATKPAPNKKWYLMSVEGLTKAAENLGDAGDDVVKLAAKILELLREK